MVMASLLWCGNCWFLARVYQRPRVTSPITLVMSSRRHYYPCRDVTLRHTQGVTSLSAPVSPATCCLLYPQFLVPHLPTYVPEYVVGNMSIATLHVMAVTKYPDVTPPLPHMLLDQDYLPPSLDDSTQPLFNHSVMTKPNMLHYIYTPPIV